MPVLIPVTSDGNRRITVRTGSGEYRFRSYYSVGQYDGWFLDIHDSEAQPLATGIRITPGAANLLKGYGDTFKDVSLTVVVLSGKADDPDGLGNGTYLLWFNPDEVNPFVVGDPLINIPHDQWAFYQDVSDKFFDSDGRGNVRMEKRILAGSLDPLFTLDADGNMRMKQFVPAGTSNDYFTLDEHGNVRMKG